MSPAPAGSDTTTVAVTEYVMPAPVIDLNCVSQFQDVGCGLTHQQVAGILVPPTMEEIAEVVQLLFWSVCSKALRTRISTHLCHRPWKNSSLPWRPHLLEKVGGNVTLQNKSQ